MPYKLTASKTRGGVVSLYRKGAIKVVYSFYSILHTLQHKHVTVALSEWLDRLNKGVSEVYGCSHRPSAQWYWTSNTIRQPVEPVAHVVLDVQCRFLDALTKAIHHERHTVCGTSYSAD